MQQKLLWAVLPLFLFATSARASDDPDPCFDASMSKSQYAACVGSSSGGYGSGGATQPPPCMSCVTGDWDANGVEYAQCKDSSVYQQSWPQYSDCKAYVSCWPGPYGGTLCETGCSGNSCLRI
jgi:hypothetical protein